MQHAACPRPDGKPEWCLSPGRSLPPRSSAFILLQVLLRKIKMSLTEVQFVMLNHMSTLATRFGQQEAWPGKCSQPCVDYGLKRYILKYVDIYIVDPIALRTPVQAFVGCRRVAPKAAGHRPSTVGLNR